MHDNPTIRQAIDFIARLASGNYQSDGLEVETHLHGKDPFIHSTMMMRDELKEKSIGRQYFLHLFNSIPTMAIIFSDDGTIMEVNRAALSWLKISAEDLIGERLSQVVDTDLLLSIPEDFAEFSDGEGRACRTIPFRMGNKDILLVNTEVSFLPEGWGHYREFLLVGTIGGEGILSKEERLAAPKAPVKCLTVQPFGRLMPHVSLTPTESRILDLISQGYTNKEIGQIMDSSSRTVESHRNNLLNKMGADTSAHLIHKAHCLGLMKPAV